MSDSRHATSMLSQAIVAYKTDDGPLPVLAAALDYILQAISVKNTIAALVPVPSSVNDVRLRIERLINSTSFVRSNKSLIRTDLVVPGEGNQMHAMASAVDRQAAAREKFLPGEGEISGLAILIDDVFTTGSSAQRCVDIVRDRGATMTLILTLARSQYVIEHQICPLCGRRMKVRRNRQDNSRFWGCTGYPDHCRNIVNIPAL